MSTSARRPGCPVPSITVPPRIQMSDAEKAEYLVESLFLNTVTYENERLGSLIRKLPSE